MTIANDKEMWCAYQPRLLTFLVTGALLLVSVCAEYTMACCVTDVELYAREMPEDPWEDEGLSHCTGNTVYFMAQCQVDPDPDDCRPIRWQFIWNDGYVTTLWTDNYTSGPCSGGTFNKTTTHSFYHSSSEVTVTAGRVGTGCAYAQDSIPVTIVEVEITDAPEYVLVYTGSEAGNEPTKTATAAGTPSGGTYLWDKFYAGSGRISYSGGTSNEVTIRGTAPSSEPLRDDVDLIVEYTSGISCETGVALRVRRMSSTTCTPGNLVQVSGRSTRHFYHRIKDQFNPSLFINETGIPCDEILTWIFGVQPAPERSDITRNHSSRDGNWYGGIAVKDTVSVPNTTEYSKHGQEIKAGKWDTSPDYYIWIHIYEGEQIWKTTH